jgi:chorismate synthase
MSTFGTLFRVTTYGESHGLSVGCVIDGVPPGLPLSESDIQPQLNRRRPGQSAITTPRNEKDQVAIHSGIEFGVTLGTPIGMLVRNEDQRPHDYGNRTIDLFPRPSHADWTYLQKYGVKASSGGGRSSARETIARVAAGAIAEKYLRLTYGVEIVAFVSAVGDVDLFDKTGGYPVVSDPEVRELLEGITRDRVDEFLPVRCPNTDVGKKMEDLVASLRDAGDSTGGLVTCVVKNLPPGLGEPCFDKLEAQLARAMMSIPATIEFAMGAGSARRKMRGSEHNDAFVPRVEPTTLPEIPTPGNGNGAGTGIARSTLATRTNFSGGIQGGISNGMPVYFSVGFKPPATISQAQTTASYDGVEGLLEAKGRHDPCVVPRAVPIVEAMAALVVMDALMVQHSREFSKSMVVPPGLGRKEPAKPEAA